MSKYVKFLFLFILLFCTGCEKFEKEDNSLACTAIFADCDRIVKEKRYKEDVLNVYNQCFDLVIKYNCNTQKFKNFVFGEMVGKNPKAK